MSKETTLDRFGRVILPKEVRDRLGLEPGTVLVLEERAGQILLTPLRGEPSLKLKDGVLVFTGKATADLANAVRRHRETRLKRIGSRAVQ